MSFRFTRVAALAFSLSAASAAYAQAAPEPAAAPQAEAAPIDPARLEAARKAVTYIFPAGTYARMMDRTVNSIMQPMMDSVGKLPLRDLAAMGGVSEEKLAAMPEGTLEEAMSILDPAFKERTSAAMPIMFKAMGGLFSEFEPAMQEGLSRAYARQFDVRQLAELNAFFATPTGSTYASNSMLVFTDPEIMSSMQALVPVMMKRMPDIMKTVEEELKKFPKRKSYDELTPEERKRFAKLMGIKEE